MRKCLGYTARAPKERGRERNGRCVERRAISETDGPSMERIMGISPSRMLVPAMLCVMFGLTFWRMQLLCV
jgi:hypothetical protein